MQVNLDSTAPVRIDTGIPFYDHMLQQVAVHGGFSLNLACKGDTEVDLHHTIEDCALALGQAREQTADVAPRKRGFVVDRAEDIRLVVEDFAGARARPPAAQQVDDLVARDGVHPGRQRLAGVVGVAPAVHGDQCFLHQILDLVG